MTSTRYCLNRPDSTVIWATDEQEAIIDFALANPTVNMLIDSLAGAAKTSTLEFLCKYLPLQPILCVAFNKRIAEEMGKRLPGHVQSSTINSLGHRAWGAAITPRLSIDKDKTHNILKACIDDLPRRDKSEAWDSIGEIRKLYAKAKSSGYLPDHFMPQVTRIISTEEFWGQCQSEDEGNGWQRLIDEAIRVSVTQAFKGNIDFDDQIFMPTLFGGTFPNFPTVMVDEAQDLSRLNHAFIRKLARGRLFAVGDQRQSIYAFRGAISSGMPTLKRDFNMTEMLLSVSFRCPIKIVERARSHAPHMQYAPWAQPGSVTSLEEWDAQSVPEGAAIICRNNAPLFSLAFRLLRGGRGVKLVGFDIGPSLVKTLKKFGEVTMSRKDLINAIDAWEQEKLFKSTKGEGTIKDKAECLRVFAGFGDTLGQAAAHAESIFSTQGTIQLLSGHKSKGLEWDVVYHLDPHRIPSPYAKSDEDQQQELNIRYVIETRAKRDMFLVRLDDFHAE